MLETDQEKTNINPEKTYMKIDTDSSTGTTPPPPTEPYPESDTSKHNPLETAKMNMKKVQGDSLESSSSNQYMTPTEMEKTGYQPQTPDTSPMTELKDNEFVPQTPSGTPPEDDILQTDLPGVGEEKQEQPVDEEKEKQLELLKQTYLDITKKKMSRQKNIFCPVIDTEKVVLPVNQLDKNYQIKLKSLLQKKLEGKCNKHGFIKEGSVNIISISSTNVYGKSAEFYVTYQALACNPVEGMIVEASVLNITKAGIRAELINFDKSPLVIFIARDHHNNSNYFNNLKERDTINVTIIGVQYELHDKFISVIGELHRM